MDRRVKERMVGATILVVLIVLIVPEMLSGPKRSAARPQPAPGQVEAVRNVTVDLATNKATTGTDEPGAPSAAPSADGAAADAPASGVAGESSSSVPGVSGSSPYPLVSGAAQADRAESGPAPAGSEGGGSAAAGAAMPPPETGSVRHSGRSTHSPTITTLQAQQPSSPPLESDSSSPRSAVQSAPRTVSHEAVPADGVHHNWALQLGSFANKPNAEKLERQLRAHGFSASVSASGAGKTLRYRVRVGPMADRAAAERVLSKLKKEGHSASVVAP